MIDQFKHRVANALNGQFTIDRELGRGGMGVKRLFTLAFLFGSLHANAQSPEVLRVTVAQAETLHVSRYGKGEQLVIVPGIWSNTFAFRKVIPSLAANGFQVTVIEMLGVSSSSRPRKADYSMTAQARRIGAVLDSLDVNSALFIGQALSTSVILRLAVHSPTRVKGLVSLEGGATDVSATPGLKRGLTFASIFFRIVPSQGIMKQRMKSSMQDVSGDQSWITSQVVDAYFAPLKKYSVRATIDAYRSIASSKEPDNIARRLEGSSLALHLLIGAAPHYGGVVDDELAPISRLSRHRVTRIAGAGHLLHEERPDLVVSAVLDFNRAR